MPGPTTQTNLSPNTVACDGGLDYISPKINVNPGTLSGCLNFERTDRVGYSRILGYEPFDGGPLASLSYTNLAVIEHAATGLNTPARSALWIVQGDGSAGPTLGYVTTSNEDDLQSIIVVTNYDQWRKLQTLLPSVPLESEFGTSYTVTATEAFDTWYKSTQSDPTIVDAKELLIQRNFQYFKMANEATIPGAPFKPVIGLHGYKDQLYAIKDLSTVWFNSGSVEVFANDTIRPTADITADNDILVRDVHLKTGTWVGGDAAGFLLVDLTPATVPTNGDFDIIRPTSRTTNALSIANVPGGQDATPWFAGMYRSVSYDQSVALSETEGWDSVDLGYTDRFVAGQSTGPFRVARRGKFSDFDTDVQTSTGVATVTSTTNSLASGSPIGTETWTFTGGTDGLILNPPQVPGHSVRRHFNSSTPFNTYTPGNLYLSDFATFAGFAGSGSITIEGVEVTVVAHPNTEDLTIRTYSVAVQPVTGNTTLQVGTSPETQNLLVNFSGSTQAVQTLVFGGPADLWGLSADDMKAGMDSGWGVAIQPMISLGGDGLRLGDIDLLMVQVKVYYKATITNYYFWNGTDDVTADITGYFVETGDWSTNDAVGTFQITNIQPVGSADRRFISANDEIRTDAGGGGLLVATVDATDMTFNGLDTLAQIIAQNSRYEIITANFYADAEFEAMYGVSGAGRAWSYDGFYFDRISTQTDASKDMPRHIIDHQFHLGLGYNSGAVLLSVLGNPQDFSGVNGAAEIDTGDPVTGLIRMQGTTLGVFCKRSVQGIVGTSIDNFALSVLGPYEGAIEYTVLDIGGRPCYCSFRGISFFDQSAAYGDFAGARLSTIVSPWLVPRLQGTISPIGTTASSFGPVCAIGSRTKNQYRLYFGDGVRLTLTLVGQDQQPQFTFQAESIYNGFGIWNSYIVPRAETSFVDSRGAEHIYIAHYSSWQSPPDDKYYVYEYDRSWTFGGFGIPAYLVLNENFYGSIFDVDTIKTVRVEGMSYGYAPLTYTMRSDYADNSTANQNPVKVVPVNLPRSPNSSLSEDVIPTTCIGSYKARGVSFNYRFMSYDTSITPATSKDPLQADICPPFVIQGLLVQITENKGDGNAS